VTDWTSLPQPVGPNLWSFPPPPTWPDDDLILVGGDLQPATLIGAYRRGIFPMEVGGTGLLGWWSPDPRGIVPLDQLHVTRSMRQSARRFHVRVDTCFLDVIRGCADPSREKGWITEAFVGAYKRLHDLGWAHSIEVFDREIARGRPLRRPVNGLLPESRCSTGSETHSRWRWRSSI
jgi:leucyl/phenylalanyl-tRNA--protein transferase